MSGQGQECMKKETDKNNSTRNKKRERKEKKTEQGKKGEKYFSSRVKSRINKARVKASLYNGRTTRGTSVVSVIPFKSAVTSIKQKSIGLSTERRSSGTRASQNHASVRSDIFEANSQQTLPRVHEIDDNIHRGGKHGQVIANGGQHSPSPRVAGHVNDFELLQNVADQRRCF